MVCSGAGHNKTAGALSGAGLGFGPRASEVSKDSDEAINTSSSKNREKRLMIETKLCKENTITSAQIGYRLPLNAFVYFKAKA